MTGREALVSQPARRQSRGYGSGPSHWRTHQTSACFQNSLLEERYILVLGIAMGQHDLPAYIIVASPSSSNRHVSEFSPHRTILPHERAGGFPLVVRNRAGSLLAWPQDCFLVFFISFAKHFVHVYGTRGVIPSSNRGRYLHIQRLIGIRKFTCDIHKKYRGTRYAICNS